MKTKLMWLDGGRFYCDEHNRGIPFYFASLDAECAGCDPESTKSYLSYEGD